MVVVDDGDLPKYNAVKFHGFAWGGRDGDIMASFVQGS